LVRGRLRLNSSEENARGAIAAIGAGQIENRVSSLNHTLTIIGELQGVLDFQRGGEAARNLNSFYTVAGAMVTEAGVSSSVELLQELVSMFARIRAAWAHVERTVTPSEPTERLRESTRPQSRNPQSIRHRKSNPRAGNPAVGGRNVRGHAADAASGEYFAGRIPGRGAE
jgi:flagellar secretion chaperone FliS